MATADNLFVLYVNGQGVGESDADNNAWQSRNDSISQSCSCPVAMSSR